MAAQLGEPGIFTLITADGVFSQPPVSLDYMMTRLCLPPTEIRSVLQIYKVVLIVMGKERMEREHIDRFLANSKGLCAMRTHEVLVALLKEDLTSWNTVRVLAQQCLTTGAQSVEVLHQLKTQFPHVSALAAFYMLSVAIPAALQSAGTQDGDNLRKQSHMHLFYERSDKAHLADSHSVAVTHATIIDETWGSIGLSFHGEGMAYPTAAYGPLFFPSERHMNVDPAYFP